MGLPHRGHTDRAFDKGIIGTTTKVAHANGYTDLWVLKLFGRIEAVVERLGRGVIHHFFWFFLKSVFRESMERSRLCFCHAELTEAAV